MKPAKTIKTGNLGKHELRLAQQGNRFFGLTDGRIRIEGDHADEVWRQLHDDVGKLNPMYFGYDGARSRFLKFFPNGFHSEGYASQERNYKLAAKNKLDNSAPLAEAAEGNGFGEAILAVYRATNMLSPFEKTRLQGLLRGPDSDKFIQSIAEFAIYGTKATLQQMEQILKPHDCAKWTIATYLPFLWRPDTHMFLKPEATKDFATRVGHPLSNLYESCLEIAVYHSLLDLAEKTASSLLDLSPRDRIDIQSFIWVVGDYREDREEIYP